MDVHVKHRDKRENWDFREFLKEYAIIVIGVLTALAAEQGVEWLHWQQQVAQADEALRVEVQFNLWSSYERVVGAPCQRDRLAELRDLLLKPGPAWKGAPIAGAPVGGLPKTELGRLALSRVGVGVSNSAMAGIYSTPLRPWREGAWSSALASGVFNHMDRARAAAYGRLYRGFEGMADAQKTEGAAKARLVPLAYDRSLTEAEKTDFLAVLGTLNYANTNMSGSGAQLILDASRNGLRIKSSDAKRLLDNIAASRLAPCARPVTIPLDPG